MPNTVTYIFVSEFATKASVEVGDWRKDINFYQKGSVLVLWVKIGGKTLQH